MEKSDRLNLWFLYKTQNHNKSKLHFVDMGIHDAYQKHCIKNEVFHSGFLQ